MRERSRTTILLVLLLVTAAWCAVLAVAVAVLGALLGVGLLWGSALAVFLTLVHRELRPAHDAAGEREPVSSPSPQLVPAP